MTTGAHIDETRKWFWAVIEEKERTDKQFKDCLSMAINLSYILGNEFLEGYLQAAYNS